MAASPARFRAPARLELAREGERVSEEMSGSSSIASAKQGSKRVRGWIGEMKRSHLRQEGCCFH